MALGEKVIPTKEQLSKIALPEMTIEEANIKCKEIYKSKPTKSVGCRVNGFVHYNYKGEKDDYLPISAVIEASMIYFLTLTHSERIEFLYKYSSKNVKVKDLKDIDKSFDQFIDEILSQSYIPEDVISKMSMDDKIKTVLNMLQSN